METGTGFTDIDLNNLDEKNKQTNGLEKTEPEKQMQQQTPNFVSCVRSAVFAVSQVRNAMIKGLEDIFYT